MCWAICVTFALLWIINKIVPIRMDPNEELLGADLMEHRIRHSQVSPFIISSYYYIKQQSYHFSDWNFSSSIGVSTLES